MARGAADHALGQHRGLPCSVRLTVVAVIAAGLAAATALAAGVAGHPVRVAPNTHHPEDLSALACPTDDECVAVGGNGIEATFNPHHPLSEYSSRIDRFHSVFAVACPSARQCTASANPGRELSFDPHHAGGWGGPRGNSRELLPGTDDSTVACASTRICVIANSATVVIFNPRTRRLLARADLSLQGNIARIACPTRRLCAAVDYSGDETTFDPVRPRSAHAHAALDRSGGFASVSCPAATQCTAIDDAGGPELTFDPATGTVLSHANVDPHTSTGATDIACPVTTQCTLIDGDYQAVTFDPLDPMQRRLLHTRIDGNQPSIACPTAAQCTALGDTLELTFNPRTAGKRAG